MQAGKDPFPAIGKAAALVAPFVQEQRVESPAALFVFLLDRREPLLEGVEIGGGETARIGTYCRRRMIGRA